MTVGRCLNWCSRKFGVLRPCEAGSVPSSGAHCMDIAFSKHHLSRTALEQLGNVVRMIDEASPDSEVAFWCFVRWTAGHHPDFLTASLRPRLLVSTELVLRRLGLSRKPVEPLLEFRASRREAQEDADYRERMHRRDRLVAWLMAISVAPLVLPFVVLILLARRADRIRLSEASPGLEPTPSASPTPAR